MVERSLCMREARGSISRISILLTLLFWKVNYILFLFLLSGKRRNLPYKMQPHSRQYAKERVRKTRVSVQELRSTFSCIDHGGRPYSDRSLALQHPQPRRRRRPCRHRLARPPLRQSALPFPPSHPLHRY